MSRLLAITLVFALAACGLKGPLTLPPGPAPDPLLGKAKNAPSAQPTNNGSDVSTPPKTNSQ